MIGGETRPYRGVEFGRAAEPDLPVVVALGVARQAEPEFEPSPRPLGQVFRFAHSKPRATRLRIRTSAPNEGGILSRQLTRLPGAGLVRGRAAGGETQFLVAYAKLPAEFCSKSATGDPFKQPATSCISYIQLQVSSILESRLQSINSQSRMRRNRRRRRDEHRVSGTFHRDWGLQPEPDPPVPHG